VSISVLLNTFEHADEHLMLAGQRRGDLKKSSFARVVINDFAPTIWFKKLDQTKG
jgi:hypothetical protein